MASVKPTFFSALATCHCLIEQPHGDEEMSVEKKWTLQLRHGGKIPNREADGHGKDKDPSGAVESGLLPDCKGIRTSGSRLWPSWAFERFGRKTPRLPEVDIPMPTVKNIPGPYRIFFYSFDCNEAKHVHVQRERMECKFWLEPIELASNEGFSPRELNRIREVIQFNIEKIAEAWDEHCGQSGAEDQGPQSDG